RLHGFPSLVHAVPAGCFASAGHAVLEPVHVSVTSHSPAAARQVAPAWPAGCVQALLEPSHSSALHGLPSSVQAVPAAVLASAGQLGPAPGHSSAGSHWPADPRHTTKPGRKPSGGQLVLDPVHVSTSSHTSAAARHTAPAFPAGCWQASLEPSHSSVLHGFPSSLHAVPAGSFASAGHAVLVPVQFSNGSHSPAEARQRAPLLPAGCWQASLEPSHSSVLHGLPSSVHAVPAGLLASAGHVADDPVHISAGSHSPADARQTTKLGSNMSLGQVLLVPVQFSSTSQTPAAARQTAPALPAGCWQASLEPLHVSVVQGLPSSVHAVPDAVFASAGHAGPVPGQFSAGSHSPADARQTVLAGSIASRRPFVLDPVQSSSTSQTPAEARQTAPALPAGCWQKSLVPLQVSVVHGLPSSVHSDPLAFFASG